MCCTIARVERHKHSRIVKRYVFTFPPLFVAVIASRTPREPRGPLPSSGFQLRQGEKHGLRVTLEKEKEN